MASTELTLELDWRTQRFADAARGLKVVGDAVGASFDKMPGVITKELKTYLEGVAEALAQRHGNPWPGGTTSKTLSRRSGHLIEAIKASVKVDGTTISAIEGVISVPNDRKIQETGGTVTAKRSKYLTIPLPAALDSRGVPLKKSARDWQNTFVIQSKAGNLLIVQKVGLQIIPLYVLKPSVTIPKRLGMGDTLRAGQSYLVDRIAHAMLQTLTGAGV